MCSVVRSETCKRDWKHLIYPNTQILVEKMKYQSYNIKARVVYELKIKFNFDKVIKLFVLLLSSVRPWLGRRTFVGSELPEYFFLYQFGLNKMACFTSLGYFWTFSSCWAYFECHWFKTIDANLHQFTLTKGGCTKIKLMQKAPSSGILHQLKFVFKNTKFVIEKHEIIY